MHEVYLPSHERAIEKARSVLLVVRGVDRGGRGWILAGLGAGMGFTTNSIAVLDDAAGGVERASSQMELGNHAGIAVGTGLAGALVGAAGATAAGLTAVFTVAAAGALLALVIPGRFTPVHG